MDEDEIRKRGPSNSGFFGSMLKKGINITLNSLRSIQGGPTTNSDSRHTNMSRRLNNTERTIPAGLSTSEGRITIQAGPSTSEGRITIQAGSSTSKSRIQGQEESRAGDIGVIDSRHINMSQKRYLSGNKWRVTQAASSANEASRHTNMPQRNKYTERATQPGPSTNEDLRHTYMPQRRKNYGNNPRVHQAASNANEDSSQRQIHQPRNNRSSLNNRGRGSTQKHHSQYHYMGFVTLEKIANANTADVLPRLNEHREGFMSIVNSSINKPDMIALILEVLSKISQSSFEEIKSKLFLDVCNSNFINSLRNYLTDLPYTQNKLQNNKYWGHQKEFWKNFITFCREILDISPGTAVRTCRALIESVSTTCLEQLKNKHGFILSEEDKVRLEELTNKLVDIADKREVKMPSIADVSLEGYADLKPPEDFRELSVIPTREDLLDTQPFLRPNVVDGAYSDVEHYLDVQFRLLREDCFGPIRDGVNQILADSTKRKYDHLRIYQDVIFIGPYIANMRVGTLVQIDTTSNKLFKRINWANSKRLIFGSLLLFTKNNFSDFIVATVLERDSIMLSTGKLVVTIIESNFGGNILDGDGYTMVESEVYFEPYFHLLKALQSPTFSIQLPMQQYIVKVTPATHAPAYLTADTKFNIYERKPSGYSSDGSIESWFDNPVVNFTVLNPETWPTKEELKFNESQYEAFRFALTHEFTVIQGPPGTGKTYVSLNVAKTLLQNIKSNGKCIMLVVCYTNHALDQLLVEISHITDKIVRIGGQSRNKEVEKFNLTNLRRADSRISKLNSYFFETKSNLKESVGRFQESLIVLDILNNGVISDELAINVIPQYASLSEYYEQYPSIENPLMHWLFANSAEYYSSFNDCLLEYENITISNNENEYNKMRTDNNITSDDGKKERVLRNNIIKANASFLITEAKLVLKNFILQYLDPKTPPKEKINTEVRIKELNSKINLYTEMYKQRSRDIRVTVTDKTDFSRILPQNRWRLYFNWIKPLINKTKDKIADFHTTVTPLVTAYDESRMMMDMELIQNRNIKVLGLTTSGAAKMRKLISAVSPKIVIVEEAAEVLEQHIITSLTKDCQHLILVGDHQQLKPSASYIKLARQYKIEVSLFERMITNGIHSRRLKVQHRMRPEISALLSPHIYPDLENHPSVENLGDVLGVEKNVFFFSHEYPEQVNVNEGNSRANHKEGDLTLGLANYIMQQGYKSHEVTILAAYSGQMFYMRKERQKYSCLRDVKITVVDNYQGEESEIILLSLVRNNPENIIGFLGTENRICVALSRAKQGFFMFGNMNMLKLKSELWRKIATTLEMDGSLGTVLNLKCQVHPDQITPIVNAEDFLNVPEGGCLRKCNYQYKCGHHCLLYCHGYDREHIETKCSERCERILCDDGHVCPKMCRQICGDCKVYVRKTLPCGHEMEVYCHREPEDPENKCQTKFDVVLPKCGHKGQKDCYMDIDKVKCTEICKQRLENCGHSCVRKCHVDYPDHQDFVCKKDCSRKNKGCTAESSLSAKDLEPHLCKKQCNEQCIDCNVQVMKKRSNCKHMARVGCCVNIDDTPCKQKCARSLPGCGHFCKKKCAEPCGDCNTMVTKVIPDCNHKVKIECHVTASRRHCSEQCKRTLSCGHPCKSVCSAECDASKCRTLVTTEVDSPCGHKVKLPCSIYIAFVKGEIQAQKLLEYCKSPCGYELACGHLCSGSCSLCHQGRIHAPCKQICNRPNICGHKCVEPCNQLCPPCSMPCEVQCPHSRCGRVCGQPCVECKEKCSRKCVHGACTRLCSEECSHAGCEEACPRALPCGHPCRGLCGEPCPPVCRRCRPEDFPTGFIGEEYGDDEKFILLQDCGHVVELDDMDTIMRLEQESIMIRSCPLCRKPVINTYRYKDLVNKMFKNDINPIKEKVYGKSREIGTKFIELQTKMVILNDKLKIHKNADVTLVLKDLVKLMTQSKNKMSLLQVEMLLIFIEILDMLVDCWTNYQKIKSIILGAEMSGLVTIILKALKFDIKSKAVIKISEQQQKDIYNEIRRMHTIVQFEKLLQNAETMNDKKVKAQMVSTKMVVLSSSIFDESIAVESLKLLQSTINSSVIITKSERQMIVRALPDVAAGSWFKCPNGHTYCIANCGRAAQAAKCPECKEAIGGTNYRLAFGNTRDSEMM